MKWKDLKVLMIFVAIFAPIMWTCLFMIMTGTVTLSYSGFAVDSQDKLYLGKDGKIEVYDEGELEYSFSSMTSRGYIFTILNDDTILLSTSTIVYTLDLHGNVLHEEEDIDTRVINSLKKIKTTFYSADGDKYVLRIPLGRTEIVRESDDGRDIIFQMPILDYIVRITLIIASISLPVFIVLFLSRVNEDFRETFWFKKPPQQSPLLSENPTSPQ